MVFLSTITTEVGQVEKYLTITNSDVLHVIQDLKMGMVKYQGEFNKYFIFLFFAVNEQVKT